MKLEINIDESTLSTLFKQKTRKEKPISFSKSLDLMWDHDKRCIRLKKERSSTFNLDNKLVGYCFAQKCGFVTPKIYQVGIPLSEVNFRNGVVVKPMYESSARGVVIVYSEDNIVYLNKNEKYSSVSEVKTYLKKLLNNETVKQDVWMVEELLVGESSIARDIKCYSFYGEVGLILETKRMPEIERCWYDADLNYVDIGKYSNRLFKGSRDDLLELTKVANKLSSELPSPFVRIDFLYCNGQFYVGEFTPLPGSFWIINQEWDEKLGVLFGQASVRLAHDISLGKIFNNYLATPKTEASAMDLIKSQID